jgi:hypothetical protein
MATEAFEFRTGCIEVKMPKGANRRRDVIVRPSCYKIVNEKTFIKVMTSSHHIATIATCMIPDAGDGTRNNRHLLKSTNVIEQLGDANFTAYKERIIEGSGCKRYRADIKKFANSILNAPDYYAVRAPDIEGVAGVTILMLRSKRGLWLELTSDNLLYFTKAVAAQFAAGGAPPRVRQRKGKIAVTAFNVTKLVAEGACAPIDSDDDEITDEPADEFNDDLDASPCDDRGNEPNDIEDACNAPHESTPIADTDTLDDSPVEPITVRSSVVRRQTNLFEMFGAAS